MRPLSRLRPLLLHTHILIQKKKTITAPVVLSEGERRLLEEEDDADLCYLVEAEMDVRALWFLLLGVGGM